MSLLAITLFGQIYSGRDIAIAAVVVVVIVGVLAWFAYARRRR